MTQITFKGTPLHTEGTLPAIHSKAPDFTVTKTDLSDLKLRDLAGKKLVLNIFPSIDTAVCALSVRKFNEEAAKLNNTVILCVSKDLPFAHARFCKAEGINNILPVSVFRSDEFGKSYGVTIKDGPVAGLFSRAIVIIDETGNIIYTEQVSEISNEPNYQEALKALKSTS